MPWQYLLNKKFIKKFLLFFWERFFQIITRIKTVLHIAQKSTSELPQTKIRCNEKKSPQANLHHIMLLFQKRVSPFGPTPILHPFTCIQQPTNTHMCDNVSHLLYVRAPTQSRGKKTPPKTKNPFFRLPLFSPPVYINQASPLSLNKQS